MPGRSRRTIPPGYSELQGRVLSARWDRMDTLGETLRDEHRKVREGGSADATDRQRRLLGYAHISSLIYNGWQMGELTPVDFAGPSVYVGAFQAHPDCATKARDAILEAVLGGAAFASLSSLLSLWAVPYFLPSWEELVSLHAAPLVYALQFFSSWVLFTVVYAGLDYYSEA